MLAVGSIEIITIGSVIYDSDSVIEIIECNQLLFDFRAAARRVFDRNVPKDVP